MIEQGRLILTMMPSLYCKLDCPHCYLTKQQRHSKDCLTLEQIKTTVEKIKRYYQQKEIHKATIDIYWYGGEPTTMGVALFSDRCTIINNTFKNHKVKHTLLSALVGVNLDDWTPVINQYCNSKIQTSYDGLMRGKRYDQAWQKQVVRAHNNGLKVNTLSVFNQFIKNDGYHKTFIKLSELGIRECGWLPFQKNIRNDETGMYDKHSTSMDEFSDFMIDFTMLNDTTNFEGKDSNSKGEYSNSNSESQSSNSESKASFLIGNELFINSMNINGSSLSNTGAQTVFLMPNGNMVMPDYDSNNIEFMKVFGNILTQSFEQILTSKSRRDWLRRQLNRNNNKECLECDSWHCCLMEFWKNNNNNNNNNDDCYGAKKYVEWLQFVDGKRVLPYGTTIEEMSIHTAIENIA
jgi:radical SAM protein with 4Fe4S-binding SPASM domain